MMRKSDYARACAKAAEIYAFHTIGAVPVDLEALVSKIHDLRLYPYSRLLFWHGSTMGEICALLGSNLGALAMRGDKYILFYNDRSANTRRIRFTIAHELGHYFLGHMNETEESMEDETRREREANCFARNLLCPAPLVMQCLPQAEGTLIRYARQIAEIFDITYDAARARMRSLEGDLRLYEGNATDVYEAVAFHRSWVCANCLATRPVGEMRCSCGADLSRARITPV